MSDPVAAAHWILQFDSIHYVLAAERLFRERNLQHDLVPTPREIHSDCGMVIQFRPQDWKEVKELAAGLMHPPGGVFRMTEGGYEPVSIGEP